MKIRYLREVSSPHVIAGTLNSERDLDDHLAKRLIREGFAERVETAPEPPIVAEAAVESLEDDAQADDPTDVIPEDDVDAT